jgi:DNA-binding CsgD family transcriptional regulator
MMLPLSIFSSPELSALEAICRYLKDAKGLRYSEIAKTLNRDQRTIWATYNNALRKTSSRLDISDTAYQIPLRIFQDRKLSVLESIVHYLKDTHHLRYSEIARLINRDERNIWGICTKAGRKLHA